MDRGPIDLMVVVGTTAKVYPAAGYNLAARKKGAKITVVNMEDNARRQGWQSLIISPGEMRARFYQES